MTTYTDAWLQSVAEDNRLHGVLPSELDTAWLAERQAAMQGQGGEVIAGGTIRFDENHWYRKFLVDGCEFLVHLDDQDRARLILQTIQSPQPVRSVSDETIDTRLVREAVDANGGVWPEELTSGVLFWRGARITRIEFAAIAQEKQS
jgi:hypothetical protein